MSTPAADTKFLHARRLEAARYAAGMTQKQLAAQMGVSTRSVQTWESGGRPWPKHYKAVMAFIRMVEGHDDGTEWIEAVAAL